MIETDADKPGTHRLIVFTDLDGTLLDHYSYSFEQALPAIRILQSRGIPWILCSSKTRSEMQLLRESLGNTWPYIFENGGGIDCDGAMGSADSSESGGTAVKSFGPPREDILGQLDLLKSGFRFRGFGDMDQAEIMRCTGLDHQAAELASQRQFTEPLLWQDSEENRLEFVNQLEKAGLRCVTGGRFIHVMGHFDKARAMDWLVDTLPGVNRRTRTVALGDSDNDVGMLENADLGVVIRSPVHDPPVLNGGRRRHDQDILYTSLPGPEGWNQALLDILENTPAGG